MHSDTVRVADRWLRDHLGRYARWAQDHNSLLRTLQDMYGLAPTGAAADVRPLTDALR